MTAVLVTLCSFLSLGIVTGNDYVGCYKEVQENPDLPFIAFKSDAEMSVSRCVTSCRASDFRFAGIEYGNTCRCGDSSERMHGNSTSCDQACTGDTKSVCGGIRANSVYRVSYDERYIGCFPDQSLSKITTLWKSSDSSPEQCINACAKHDKQYAGARPDGHCVCANTFNRDVRVNTDMCNSTCRGWRKQNCGGNAYTAIYDTYRAFDVSTIKGHDGQIVTLYNTKNNVIGFPLRLFNKYPNLRTFISKRLIIHASEKVVAPFMDKQCSKDCYTTCGSLHQERLEHVGEQQTLRFFHVRLSQLNRLVDKSAKRVYVYALTVVIDTDLHTGYSLLIRTNKLIVDQSRARSISVPGTTPELGIDLEDAKVHGPPSNNLHMKQTFMCSRILLSGRNIDERNRGFQIMNDLQRSGSSSNSEEQRAFRSRVRAYASFLTGIVREDLNFIPFYTKAFISEVLTTYHNRIQLYKQTHDKISDAKTKDTEFIEGFESLLSIYATTDVSQTKAQLDTAIDALRLANRTYFSVGEEYAISKSKNEQAKQKLEQTIKEIEEGTLVTGIEAFIECVENVILAVATFDKSRILESIGEVVEPVADFIETVVKLAETMKQLDHFVNVTREIDRLLSSNEKNYMELLKYMDDISFVSKLKTSSVHWQNMKFAVNRFFRHERVAWVRHSDRYRQTVLNLCNWGDALTKAMMERAEVTRAAVQARFTYEGKLAEVQRNNKLLEETKKNVKSTRERALHSLNEQTHDVRIDLNEALLVFCQAFKFENMKECGENYRPSFGGSLEDLLIKINAARRDAMLLPEAPSTVNRKITLRDAANVTENCEDATVCPVTYFKKNSGLYLKITVDNPELSDIYKYRIHEVEPHFVGVRPSAANTKLKVQIEAVGNFMERDEVKMYDFLTKALSVTHEYDVVTGHVSIRADIYKPVRNMVQNVTPFTTWILRVSRTRSADIDFSQLQSIEFRFRGSGIDVED